MHHFFMVFLFFLSWYFYVLLLLNYAKYCKITIIIDKIYKIFRIFLCSVQDLLILSQKVTIIYESCIKNPKICTGIVMKNVTNASCANVGRNNVSCAFPLFSCWALVTYAVKVMYPLFFIWWWDTLRWKTVYRP